MRTELGAGWHEKSDKEIQPKKISTTVDKLLPGIKGSSISSAEIEIGVSRGAEGSQYHLRFERLFDQNNVKTLIASLTDRNPPPKPSSVKANSLELTRTGEPKRTRFYDVETDDREEFDEEYSRIAELKPDMLEEAASDIFTLNRARLDFLKNPSAGRDYNKLFENEDENSQRYAYLSGFMGEIASLMKKHPDLWRNRKTDTLRVSDTTAISRYVQISNLARAMIHQELLDSKSQGEQEIIIENHMSLVYGTKVLRRDDDAVGFINSTGEIAARPDGKWVMLERGIPIFISQQEDRFIIDTPHANVLVGEVSWGKNGGRVFIDRDIKDEVVERRSRLNPDVDLVYRIDRRNISRLLGVMLLDLVSNTRERISGKYGDQSRIPEDVYARRHAILNTELIRNAEVLLAS